MVFYACTTLLCADPPIPLHSCLLSPPANARCPLPARHIVLHPAFILYSIILSFPSSRPGPLLSYAALSGFTVHPLPPPFKSLSCIGEKTHRLVFLSLFYLLNTMTSSFTSSSERVMLSFFCMMKKNSLCICTTVSYLPRH